MWRAYEPLLFDYLKLFPCVALLGPRQCGKTTLLSTLGEGWRRIDLERSADLQNVARDPDLFLRLHPRQVAIDESQLLPELFFALRVAIDDHRSETGRFVITGSSSPDLLDAVAESLAGRVGIIKMAPLAWSEVCGSRGPGLARLIIDRTSTAKDLASELTERGNVALAHRLWLHGGYPEPWLRDSERFRKLWMEQYVQTYLHRDIGRLFPGLDRNRFLLFLQMLANLSGQILNVSEVARALSVSQPTARDYFDIAHGTFVWRKLPPFERDATQRIVKHCKGYLRDSGLLHHLLRLPDLEALMAHPQVGRSWEGMVIEEFHRQLACSGEGFDSYFYRTAAGAEVDLVLEGEFGRIPVEIKYGTTVPSRSLRSLRDFVRERNCRFGIVINNDTTPRLYEEKLVGIPFTYV